MDRNQQYKTNKEAKVGETIICPVCGRAFVKKQYSQAFCCGGCKDSYWNKKGDRHKRGYYKRYDQEHPERIERAAFYALGGGRMNAETRREYEALIQYRTDKAFKEYVDSTELEGGDGWDGHECYVSLADQLDAFYGYGE